MSFHTNIRKEYIKIGLGLTSLALTSYFAHEYFQYQKALQHPTREIAEMALKLDKRVTNFCGRKYKISNYQMINEDDNYCTYRMKLSGMRGTCKVLVKCQKHTHAELKAHSQEQINYSKKTKEQKAISPFIPYNYTDIIIPTKETLKLMKETLKSKNLNDEDLIFHRKKYLNGDYHATKDEFMKTLKNKNIENADTFYRIASLTMVANDNLVFNIRPIGPKHRNYDIEDTVYTYKSYDDVVKKLMNLRFLYSDMLIEDFSDEEFRNEVILQKQTNINERLTRRKYITFFNFAFFLASYAVYKVYMRQRIDVTTIKSLQSKVINMSNVKQGLNLGLTKRLICISYKYNPVQNKFNIYGLVMGEKGAKIGIETTALVDDISPHGNVTIYNLNSGGSNSGGNKELRSREKDVKINV